MITLTTTIQEISLQAYAFGVFDYLFNERNMSRDEILNIFEDWGKEFEDICRAHTGEDDWFYYDEVDAFINRKFNEMKLQDIFPCGLAVGDFISYEGGIYKVTGVSDSGILVDERVAPGNGKDWITVEIGFSQAEKIEILDNYEDIVEYGGKFMPEYVEKINRAWNERREEFCPILRVLYDRDVEKFIKCSAYNWTADIDSIKETLWGEWDFFAHGYFENIAEEADLRCILDFLHIAY